MTDVLSITRIILSGMLLFMLYDFFLQNNLLCSLYTSLLNNLDL